MSEPTTPTGRSATTGTSASKDASRKGGAPKNGASKGGASSGGPSRDGSAQETPSTDGAAQGPALARAALEAALARRAATAQRRHQPGQGGDRGKRRRGYTGPGPDPRDPQPLSSVLDRLVKTRGWQRPTAEATVFGAWDRVVGSDVAAHCHPVRLERGELTVEAESTAWATQLRMLTARLVANIAREIGPNVVIRLHVHGPAAPSWNRGPRRVRGRGPRDTYG